ncbi:hypothetical protein A2318_00535 [Candidatus Uhrbacteria bacterium RIFOXYB2_FULL_45_11]|uniref:Glycosyl transferase family 28 C-terminal domain-containing protein n=1 Tax=Candidatus Uhrbacteria bacterium RIFOXYB2_FULL_45_11 TaxID=1802421 RepID=A0A1F7W7D9_9BACT|nr:MAG: hypothetical protein A2318_00535 [Candidatus Uhrbacteria bacterium RIFOXYB2_FULL_45_11]
MKKILYGVCGIGNGHTQRALPLIEHFAKQHQVVIFAYGSSLAFFRKQFDGHDHILVLEVAVPFYVGNKEGIDFEATKNLPANQKEFDAINANAFALTEELLGTPDLVISDYEPISAEYSYKHNAPLVTIDQQSKYLTGDFPTELHGETFADEVARLKLFFPIANDRIACSFFDVTKTLDGMDVKMFPPILKESILDLRNIPAEPKQILVYLSSQKEFPQTLEEIVHVCASQPDVQFHIFAPDTDRASSDENVSFYKHGDASFVPLLATCSGIISTAGHTLLSEAMHLGIPVYAIPLPVYEQQMNAEVIDQNGFGLRAEAIEKEALERFIVHLESCRSAILSDTRVLLKGDGTEKIVRYLNGKYLL